MQDNLTQERDPTSKRELGLLKSTERAKLPSESNLGESRRSAGELKAEVSGGKGGRHMRAKVSNQLRVSEVMSPLNTSASKPQELVIDLNARSRYHLTKECKDPSLTKLRQSAVEIRQSVVEVKADINTASQHDLRLSKHHTLKLSKQQTSKATLRHKGDTFSRNLPMRSEGAEETQVLSNEHGLASNNGQV